MESRMKLLFCAFTLILSINTDLCYGLRILGIFPFPIRSHEVMSEELMKGLAAKGHQVDVYSHFPQKNAIPNYTDYSLEGTVPKFSNNVTYEYMTTSWNTNMFENWYGEYGSYICELMDLPIFQKLLKDPPQDPPYDLFVFELAASYCYLPLGRHLNVPIVGVVTNPLSEWTYEAFGSPLNLATDASIDLPYSPPMKFLERLHNVLYYYSAVYQFKYYVQSQNKYVKKYFGAGYPPVLDLQKDVSLILVNYDQALNGVRPFAPIIIPVGGLHVVDRNETLPKVVQKWLDESNDGCIYFSFGSMTRIETFPRHVLDIFYKAFKNIAPVRVLLKIAKPEELPPGLPSNVLTQPWLKQTQVLKHKNIKAFVTHGGLMGTQEAIFYGVPLVGIPLFYDQPFNIAAYEKRKIAVKVDINKMTEESFTNSLKKILEDPIYRESMQNTSKKFKDHPMKPLETAMFWIEYIHRHGKDTLRSPVTEMPWWQAYLLDVYGFIMLSISLSLYVIFLALKKLISIVRFNYNRKTKVKKN